MRVFFLLTAISISSTAVVEWTPNTSFNLPINFRDHKIPCSKQAVVFPETIEESIKIESEIAISEFILPKNGELLLEDAVIAFGADVRDNCTDTGTAYYMPKMESSWADPDVWSSPKFNKATPDAERVPCYNDEVVFPTGSQFTISLPKEKQNVQKLTINGRPYNTVSFYFRVHNPPEETTQAFVLNDFYTTGLHVANTKCVNPIGCPCQENVLRIHCEIKFCPTPKCSNPIQPTGHCCKICGGCLVLNPGKDFDMLAFQNNVNDIVNSYGASILEYHIGVLPDNKIQLVVVDKEEYDGTSVQAVSDIEYKINKRGLQSLAYFSGVPSSKSGLGAKIIFSMFFLVVLVMGAIYLYYYKTPRLPKISYPTVSRSTREVFSRFSKRSESLVSLTSRRDSTATLGSGGATAFRNPMYDSKRGRVQVTEPVDEE